MVVRGSCLCSNVAYELAATPIGVFHCHCSRCRKVRGTAHATNMAVPIDSVRFVRGEDELTTFQPKDAVRFRHVFCKTCGSSMPNLDRARGWAVVPMGSLDDPPPAFTAQHIFVGSKASWDEITDDLPQHEAAPPRKE